MGCLLGSLPVDERVFVGVADRFHELGRVLLRKLGISTSREEYGGSEKVHLGE